MGRSERISLYDQSLERLAPELAARGFRLVMRGFDDLCPSLLYRNGDLYIRIQLECEARNRPSFMNVDIGEGESELPFGRWNNVPLRRFLEAKQVLNPLPVAIWNRGNVQERLGWLVAIFESELAGFLSDDQQRFREIRAELNRECDPFMYERTRDDWQPCKVNLELKEHFSEVVDCDPVLSRYCKRCKAKLPREGQTCNLCRKAFDPENNKTSLAYPARDINSESPEIQALHTANGFLSVINGLANIFRP